MRIVLLCIVIVVTSASLSAQGTTSRGGADTPQQAVPAPGLAQRGPLAPASERMLRFARDGLMLQSAAIGRQYAALHPGTPRVGEHCMVLVQLAYAEMMLSRQAQARAALSIYEDGCRQKTFPDAFRLEAQRVHRVLAGEPMVKVYPPQNGKPSGKQ